MTERGETTFHRLRQRYRQLLREKLRTRWQRQPRLKMKLRHLIARCARNLFGISVHYLSEGNGRTMRITTGTFCRKCGAAIPPIPTALLRRLPAGDSLGPDEPVAGAVTPAVRCRC